ncbi:TlpA family protein disulfide reductase [Rubrobacter indicoceani]|uniref:TlpA family protein disulfide reductase n=1 Tax=Rubrobacter indicoceani TaxID=2051957 RepID=UPI0013C47F97|nr:redoxin domain-containing protein [Rubrobacter indicoceani]
MRRLIVVVVIVLAAAGFYRSFGDEETGTGSLTLPQPYPTVGSSVPSFRTASEEGGTFALRDEGTYVLTFWSTLNRQSNQSRASFERLAGEFPEDDVKFAAVYVNSAPERASANYEVLQDRSGTLTQGYNIKRVPRLFLIVDGRVRLVQTGFYGEYEEQLEEEIRAAIEGG